MKNINIITHSGTFHSDEVFAIALLHLIFMGNINVTRTRDKDILSQAVADKDTFVVDVGGSYDPTMLNFDHHHKEFDVVNSYGNKMSSFGAVVRWAIDNGHWVNTIEKLLDFSNRIDCMDNGIDNGSIEDLRFISVFNNCYEDLDKSFDVALNVAINYLMSLANAWDKAERIQLDIETAIANRSNGIISFDGYIPVDERCNAVEDAKVVVYKSNTGVFNIQSLNVGTIKDFSMRNPMPESWRGLSGTKLQETSGIQDLEFCHSGGFLLVTKTDNLARAVEIARSVIV